MKLLDAKVDWKLAFDTAPMLQVLVDKIPNWETEMRFQVKPTAEGALYYAELDGYVKFFAHDPRNRNGYNGARFSLRMADGDSLLHISGPWASRPSVMNWAAFPPCVGMEMTDSIEAFHKGYTFFSAAITLELATQAAKLAGVKLLRIPSVDEMDRHKWIELLGPSKEAIYGWLDSGPRWEVDGKFRQYTVNENGEITNVTRGHS